MLAYRDVIDVSATALGSTVRSARATSEDAFERLFASEYRRVVAIAARVLGRRESAEDVAQEVFVAFARRYPAGASFAAPWLHTAAAHAALNVIRGERRRRDREARDARLRDPLEGAGAIALDPANAALRRDEADVVHAALGRISKRYGTILALRYGGLSYAEIAVAIGAKPSSIGTMLARAEAAFARALDA